MVAKLPTPATQTLTEALDERTAPGELVQPMANGRVRCVSCGHRCVIPPDARGICKVRFNRAGQLRVPFGYVGSLQVDPVEKKPFFHLLPGSSALSFGMLGCDFHCGYCQNWVTSQALRDPAALGPAQETDPARLVEAALAHGSRILVSTYNEPLITSEWAVAVFQEARRAGLKTAYVSNGNATPEALDYLQPWIDAYKVDLKSMQDRNYRQLGGVLDHVLEIIQALHQRGIWLEVVTLIVPGFNDSDAELRSAAEFLAGVSSQIPWHVTAFHPDYKMRDPERTPARTLQRAAEIGREAGLRSVYAGNLPGGVGEWEDTHCNGCSASVIRRRGFEILEQRLDARGACPTCGTLTPGIWV